MFVCYSVWSQENLNRPDVAYNVGLMYTCEWRLVLTIYTKIIYCNARVTLYVAYVEEHNFYGPCGWLRPIEVL
jgi:hypothetical protein